MLAGHGHDRSPHPRWSRGSTRPGAQPRHRSPPPRRPLTLADKVLLGHLDDPERQRLEPGASYLLAAPRPRGVPGRARADRPAAVHADAARATSRCPTTIHCDHLIQARVEGGPDLRASLAREPRGLRLPALGGGQVRRGLLGAGRRHHPPGRAGELRVPRRRSSSAPTRTRPTPAASARAPSASAARMRWR